MSARQDPDLEECRFCGLHVESPCDSPPPSLCQHVFDVLMQSTVTAVFSRRKSGRRPRYEWRTIADLPVPLPDSWHALSMFRDHVVLAAQLPAGEGWRLQSYKVVQ